MLLTQALKILNGLKRTRSLTGDIETEEVVRFLGNAGSLALRARLT